MPCPDAATRSYSIILILSVPTEREVIVLGTGASHSQMRPDASAPFIRHRPSRLLGGCVGVTGMP